MEQKIGSTLKRYNYIEGAIGEQYHLVASALGLSDSAFDIMYVLYQERDGCAQSVIYRMSGMSRKTAGSSLQKLREEGLIEISKDTVKRGNTVYLTDKGKVLVEEKIAPVVQAENDVFNAWTGTEQEIFLNLSNRYLEEITKRFQDIIKMTKNAADGGREP